MMGTLSFLVNGAMCCCVVADGLMVRVTPEGREQALSEPYVRPMKMGGRPMSTFVLVDTKGIESDVALAKWIGRGVIVAAEKMRRRASKR